MIVTTKIKDIVCNFVFRLVKFSSYKIPVKQKIF